MIGEVASRRLKVAALLCLAITMVILIAFAIGEVASGTISGLQHLLQLLPLAVLAWLGWARPRWGGVALIALSLILAGFFIVMSGAQPLTLLVSAALLFLPPLLAGILFLAADRRAASSSARAADSSRHT